ncbi:MAG: response regulator [Bacteroidetes bacterium]|nr:response regulator [Bacteroidota bacterium]
MITGIKIRFYLLTAIFLCVSSFVYPQIKWFKYPGNPVIEPKTINEWDYTIIPKVVLFENDQYQMWYKGWNAQNVAFGYATSPDGINWIKDENNPLEFSCEGDCWDTWMGSIDIIKKDSVYYMWYAAGSKENNTGWIGYAYSADGLNWIKHTEPVLKPTKNVKWEAWGLGGPRVVFDGTRYHMWYNGNAGGIPVIGRVGYATSDDGIVWKKHPTNPVLNVGKPGTWEDHAAMVEAVIYNGSYFEMWYHGWNLVQHELGYATSFDGINWKKFPGNPVIRAGEVGEWDAWLATYPAIIRQDSVYRMWYYGHDNARGRVGYATTLMCEVKAWDTIKINKPQRTIKVQVFNLTEFIKVDSLADKLLELNSLELIDAYNKLALAYALNDSKKCLNYAERALKLANQEGYPQGKAMALYTIGTSQYVMDNYTDALVKQLEALWLFDSLNMIFEKANLLSQIAGIHSYTGSYDLACKYYRQALKLFELQKDTGCILHSLIYLGYSYLMNGDTTRGIKTFNRRLKLAIENKNAWKQVDTYEALGLCYSGRKLDSALYYFREAETIWDTLHQGYLAYNYMITAEAYCAAGTDYYNLAEDYFLKSYERAGNGRQMQVRLLYDFADLYFKTGRYDKCREYLQVALHMCRNYLAKQNHQMFTFLNEKMDYEMMLKPLMEKIYWLFYRLDSTLNNEKSAFKYYKLATQWKDSIYNLDNKRQWAMMQGEYETEKAQNQISLLEKDNKVKSLTIKRSRIILIGFAALVLLIVLVTIIFIRNKKIKTQHALELEQVKIEKLQELDRLKSRFFANISHEFRTPLTLIMRPLEKLLSKTQDEIDKKELTIARKYAQSLQKLINNLLALSRLESGKMQLHATEINIVKLVNGYFQAFESLAKQKNIKLHFNAKNEKINVFIDQEKFEQILNNLLSNAFKFTGDGGKIEIAVSLWPLAFGKADEKLKANSQLPTASNSHWAEIKISDTGCGIPPENIDHIFNRFYQMEQKNNSYYEGTGIGLALTKELVELHHGIIKVDSEQGIGSTFTILLPLGNEHLGSEEIILEKSEKTTSPAIAPVQSDDQNELASMPNSDQDNNDAHPILLIVEDNADMLSYIREYFEHEYKIIEAVDGRDGYEKAIDKIPDVIISDVMMPNMDGNELCAKVKTDERTCHIPVILLTALTSKENRIEGLETGADDFIAKPFDGDELQVRVKNLINQRKRTTILERNIQKSHAEIKLDFEGSEITSMDKKFIQKTVLIVKQRLSDSDFSVEELSIKAGMSRSQLHRKLKALVGQSASEFIRTMRLNAASELLASKAGNVAEIAFEVGFNNLSWFSKCFQQQFGILPSEYFNQTKKP